MGRFPVPAEIYLGCLRYPILWILCLLLLMLVLFRLLPNPFFETSYRVSLFSFVRNRLLSRNASFASAARAEGRKWLVEEFHDAMDVFSCRKEPTTRGVSHPSGIGSPASVCPYLPCLPVRRGAVCDHHRRSGCRQSRAHREPFAKIASNLTRT